LFGNIINTTQHRELKLAMKFNMFECNPIKKENSVNDVAAKSKPLTVINHDKQKTIVTTDSKIRRLVLD